MNARFFSATKTVCAALFFLLFAGVAARAADDLKLEAQLVLGSNEAPPGGTPVSPQIEKKLKRLPLKWGHYSVISSQQFSVAKDEAKEVSLSDACQISVKNLGGQQVQLTLMGNGRDVGKVRQSLKKGQTLVAGGNAGNTIVVLWQMD
jgi:WD40 repeat protein